MSLLGLSNGPSLMVHAGLKAARSARRSSKSSMVNQLVKRASFSKSATQILRHRKTSSASLPNADNSEQMSTTWVLMVVLLSSLHFRRLFHLHCFPGLRKSLITFHQEPVVPGSEICPPSGMKEHLNFAGLRLIFVAHLGLRPSSKTFAPM